MNKKIVIGNWKMNPATIGEAKRIADKAKLAAPKLKQTETVICPPFVFASIVKPKNNVANLSLGAQSVSRDESGSHTGEVSAAMLKDIGVEYVIVGHSEERGRGETSEIAAKKVSAVLEAGLIPVVCVGENARDVEGGSHFEFLKQQIKDTFALVPKKDAKEIIVAYEPVWAIGAAEPMVSDQIYEMVIFVRKVLSDIFDAGSAMKIKVLYGGSVNAGNAADIINIGKVDGFLVGRESVSLIGFTDLLKVVDSI
jgi:triosephosphate isomerase